MATQLRYFWRRSIAVPLAGVLLACTSVSFAGAAPAASPQVADRCPPPSSNCTPSRSARPAGGSRAVGSQQIDINFDDLPQAA